MAIGIVDVNALNADVNAVARNWWAVLIRGIAAVVFGVLTLMTPGISLFALILLFGVYAFADGIFSLVGAVRQRGGRAPTWMLVVEGLAGIAAGIVTFFSPGLTAIALLYLIAAWALVTGVLEIVLAVRMRKVITGEWLLVLSGIASLALGVVLILFPGAGALALVLWIGSYALVFGIVLIALSLRLRSWARSHGPNLGHPRPAAGAASA